MSITETFSRSWDITKQSFRIIRSDKEIMIFPVLATIFSLIFVALMAVPFLMANIMEQIGLDKLGSLAMYLIMFIIYLGLAFISTFFNVAVVYCAKKRFEGGDPTFGEGLKEAAKRIHIIFLWSMLSATVGIILRMIENAAKNNKNYIARLILSTIAGLAGAAWSIVTLFVVPALVFDNVGPFQAIKKSVETLKKTWGESLVRHYGLGMAQFAFIFIGALVLLVPGIIITVAVYWPVGVGLIGLFILYIIIVSLIFGTADTIFNTALYMYAKDGKTPSVYAEDTMKNAFEAKK
jgi:hypothetical protein